MSQGGMHGSVLPVTLIPSDANVASDAESGLLSKEKKEIAENRCDLNNVGLRRGVSRRLSCARS